MEMREWLSIIVIVAIVLIVLDGFRRKRKERNPVRMKLDKNLPPAIGTDEDEALAELPGGGARTIPRDRYQTTQPKDKAGDGKHGRKRKMEERVRFEEKVPVLMDSVNIAPEVEAKEAREAEEEQPLYADSGKPVVGLQQEEIRAGRRGADDDGYEDEDEDDYEDDEEDEDDYEDDEDEDDYEEEDDFAEDDDEYRSGKFDGNDEFDEEYEDEEDFDDEDEEEEEDDFDDEDEDEFEEDYDDEEEDAYSRLRGGRTGGRIEPTFASEDALDEDELPLAAAATEAPKVQRSQLTRDLQGELPLGAEDYDSREIAATDEELGAAEEVIVINVMARKGDTFHGKELLPVLLSQGMRLGDMSIFHRHADSSGNGPVIFSMANMVKPGTFDMGAMEDFGTPGVSFFQQLPGPLDNMKNFERMLNTATTLRDALDGELKDENRSVLTRQTIEHYRQRIRDFELRQELARKQPH